MNNCELDDLGEYFFVVAADIDSEARGNPACDMGADEFDPESVVGTPPVIIDQQSTALRTGPAGHLQQLPMEHRRHHAHHHHHRRWPTAVLVMDANFCSPS
jgi:hypothetical protein